VVDEVLEIDLIALQVAVNVLLDPAGDEEPERDEGVSLEEVEQVVNEGPDVLTVLAFVESIDDDQERSFEKGRHEQTAPLRSGLEWLVHEATKLGDQTRL
jgi:hypothetical protein